MSEQLLCCKRNETFHDVLFLLVEISWERSLLGGKGNATSHQATSHHPFFFLEQQGLSYFYSISTPGQWDSEIALKLDC